MLWTIHQRPHAGVRIFRPPPHLSHLQDSFTIVFIHSLAKVEIPFPPSFLHDVICEHSLRVQRYSLVVGPALESEKKSKKLFIHCFSILNNSFNYLFIKFIAILKEKALVKIADQTVSYFNVKVREKSKLIFMCHFQPTIDVCVLLQLFV